MSDPAPNYDDFAVNGRSILAVAHAALLGLQGTSMVPDDWEPVPNVFLSHGQPPDDCCEYLTVWADSIGLASDRTFPQPATFVLPCNDGRLVIRYILVYKRDCLPGPTADRGNPFPSRDDEDDAAQTLAVEGRAIWCAVQSAHAQGTLVDDGFDVIFGTMLAVRGGGCGGWRWPITVEAKNCCTSEA